MKKLFIIYTLSMLILSCGKNDNGRFVPYAPLRSNAGILDTHTGIIYQPIYDLPEEPKFIEFAKIIKIIETDYIHRTKKQYDFVDSTKMSIEDK